MKVRIKEAYFTRILLFVSDKKQKKDCLAFPNSTTFPTFPRKKINVLQI
jgi:hypothetical protein